MPLGPSVECKSFHRLKWTQSGSHYSHLHKVISHLWLMCRPSDGDWLSACGGGDGLVVILSSPSLGKALVILQVTVIMDLSDDGEDVRGIPAGTSLPILFFFFPFFNCGPNSRLWSLFSGGNESSWELRASRWSAPHISEGLTQPEIRQNFTSFRSFINEVTDRFSEISGVHFHFKASTR